MSLRAAAIALVLLQLVDVAIHALTGQFEITRIVSSALLGGWALAVLLTDFRDTVYTLGRTVFLFYLALNLFFVYENGLTNPEMGGELRILLIALVLASAYLASVVLRRLQTE
ncbi:MAG: hypothetical protein KIS88_03075 [Anaerolineales bacterium]|nr:hypothetical protein [Anaerolineales bacterium]